VGFGQVVVTYITGAFSSPLNHNAKSLIVPQIPSSFTLVLFCSAKCRELARCTFVRPRNKIEFPPRLEFHYSEFGEHASSSQDTYYMPRKNERRKDVTSTSLLSSTHVLAV
jgi:hypothetical protein